MLMLDVKLQKQDYHKLFMCPDLGHLVEDAFSRTCY